MRKDSNLMRKTFTYEGKRYDVYGKSDRELIRKQTAKIESLKRNEVQIESSMTVRSWAEYCTDTYKTNLNDKSLKNYKYLLNHYILSEIGSLKLKEVKQLQCQQVLNRLSDLSDRTIKFVAQIQTFIFEKAVDNRLISHNPTKGVTRPKGKPYQHRRALTEYEERIFLDCAAQHSNGLLFMFMWGCGCRPSEAQHIEGRDIHFIKGKPFLHIRGTKTKNADREVPIPDVVMDMIPDDLEPDRIICTTKVGTSFNEQSTKRAWHSLERDMSIAMGCKMYRNEIIPPYPLANDLSPYCLRHTYCTNLAKRGVDIRTAQQLMGHSDISLTANIYTHVTTEHLSKDWDLITGSTNNLITFKSASTL